VSDVVANLAAIRARIAAAAIGAGRDPASVTLVAISKTYDAETIRPALESGQRCFGEARVQEAKAKWAEAKAAHPDLHLHLIGPLQTNKVREAIALFDVIETIDRPKLARVVAEEMQRAGRRPLCLVEINTGAESQKAGIEPALADALIKLCRDEYHLPLVGVMGIPPAGEDPLPHFQILTDIAARNGLAVVSMGMSGDFEQAIAAGATHVRVGSAIFGARG
jgi:PLP dependent protein